VAKSQALTAISYLRVSGNGQRFGDGFPRQRDTVTRFARAHGFALVGEFSDTGISGATELEDRPGLAALLDRVESNGVKTVLVENASRLARDLMVQEIIIGRFREVGVRVVAADSGTDLTVADGDPTRKLIRQVLGAVSEFEKSVLVLKLRAARERIRRTQGRCEGAKSYGSYPGEAAIVERMRRLRRKPAKGRRASLAEIAATLNAEGFRNRAGREWSPRMVWHVLDSDKLYQSRIGKVASTNR
jgi:DNA invertase Pin-like site-specific DNA recombinase